MTPDRDTPGERRRLDRPPGDRYRTSDAATEGVPAGGGARWIVAAVAVADIGAIVYFVLGLLDLAFGLVAVAAFVGWATALALVFKGRDAAIRVPQVRMATAAFLGGWAVVLGTLLDWLFGLSQGGVLGFFPYVAERYWLVAPAALVAGAFVAAYRAR